MGKSKANTIIVWIFCLMVAAFPAFWMPANSIAGDGGGPRWGGGHHGRGPLRMLEKLNLSDDQNRQAANILKAKRDQAGQILSQMATARKNLFTLAGSADYNETAIQQAAHEVARCQEDLLVLRAQTMHEIQAILTPEQKDKMQTLRARFGQRMQRHFKSGIDQLDQWIDEHSG